MNRVIAVFAIVLHFSSQGTLAAPGDTEIVSVDGDGLPGSSYSYKSVVSNDGRYVVFESAATSLWDNNLPPSYCCKLLLADRDVGVIEELPMPWSLLNPTMTPDGRYVLAASHTNALWLYDRTLDTLENIHMSASGEAGDNLVGRVADMTPDGCHIVFESAATNLVPGDDNNLTDVFVVTRETSDGTCPGPAGIERVSLSANPELSENRQADGASGWGPTISNDGRWVAFTSQANNLLDPASYPFGDTNPSADVFVHDRTSGAIELVTTADSQTAVGGYLSYISGNGQYVAFQSSSTQLCPSGAWCRETFLRDRTLKTTTHLSRWNGNIQEDPHQPVPTGISDSGLYVSLYTAGGEYWVRETSKDSVTGLAMVHVNELGQDGNGFAWGGAPRTSNLSANGRFITLDSDATNLADIDGDGAIDSADAALLAVDAALQVYLHQVLPFTPKEMIDDIIEDIIDLNLDNGISNNLDAKLNTALDALDDMNDSNNVAACGSLAAMKNAIEAQSGTKIDELDAKELIDDVKEVEIRLGCISE